jgi:hypothetical protein
VSAYIPESLKTQIREGDRDRCCYCLTSEANSGLPMSFDHIQPQSKGGNTSFENVCLACRSCNEYKSNLTEAQDPLTGEIVPFLVRGHSSGQNTPLGAWMPHEWRGKRSRTSHDRCITDEQSSHRSCSFTLGGQWLASSYNSVKGFSCLPPTNSHALPQLSSGTAPEYSGGAKARPTATKISCLGSQVSPNRRVQMNSKAMNLG